MIKWFLNRFFGYFPSWLVDYSGMGLSELNGQQKLVSGSWKDLLINGQALLGNGKDLTMFQNIVVVNGELKADGCLFDLLDVRGNFRVRKSICEKKAMFFGSGVIEECNMSEVDLRIVGGKVVLRNCKVRGDIVFSSGKSFFSRLVLDNCSVSGLVWIKDQKKVRIVNCTEEIRFGEVS